MLVEVGCGFRFRFCTLCSRVICCFCLCAERQGCVFVHMPSQLPAQLCFVHKPRCVLESLFDNKLFTAKHCTEGSLIQQTAIMLGKDKRVIPQCS